MLPQVQIPDFAGTIARGIQTRSALADAASQDAFRAALGEIAPQLGTASPERRLALLAQLAGAGTQGAQLALPMLSQERERAEGMALIRNLFPGLGGATPATPAAPAPAASGAPVASLPPVAPRGDAPPAVAQGIAARARLDPNAPDYPEQIMRVNDQVVGATMPGGAPRPAAPTGATPPGQAGLPTPQQLIALMASGNPAAMNFARSIAPLVARENPNWVTATVGNEVRMVNPQNPREYMVLGPSSDAAGRDRSPFGTGASGAALAFIEQHARAVAAGTASPDVVQRYLSAVTEYQQERISADGQTRIVPRLPPYAPGADFVVQRYPGVVPGAQTAPAAPAAPAPAPQQQGGVAIPGTTMQASPPELTPSPLPSAAGGVARGTSSQAREAARTAELGAGRVLDAINNFRTALAPFRGATGIAAYNPQSPEGQRLASAYEVLKMTMRDESLLNTGVLQPGENVMIERMLRSPTSVLGVLTSIDAYNTMLDEFAGFVQRGTDRVRSSANLPPVDWSQPRQNITPDPRGANRPDPLGLLGGPRR